MKLMKRTGTYKAANVTFDPTRMTAFSYSWWKFVGVVEGKLIFNNYRYSNSTSKHQSKVRAQMAELGITADVEMPIPEGLPGTYHKYGQEQKANTMAELVLATEEFLCDEFLRAEDKRDERNAKLRAKRALERAEKDAQFKRNLDSITEADIISFRAQGGLK